MGNRNLLGKVCVEYRLSNTHHGTKLPWHVLPIHPLFLAVEPVSLSGIYVQHLPLDCNLLALMAVGAGGNFTSTKDWELQLLGGGGWNDDTKGNYNARSIDNFC